MNKSILMIMGGGVIIAIVVAMLVDHGLSPKRVGGAKEPTVRILAASKMLFAGQKLLAADVYWRPWPKNLLYQGLIKKSDQPDPAKLSYYGSPLRHDLEADEPVTTESIITSAKGDFLEAFIAPGMRAMSINVRANTGAAGFVSPGDHVDVILSYTPRVSSRERDAAPDIIAQQASEVILSDVKVLAVDQKDKSTDHSAKIARTVTLEVTPKGAQTLALASQMGTLYLALRRLGDNKKTPERTVTDVDISQVMQELNARVEDRGTGGPEVRLYNGNAVENVPVRPVGQ